MFKAFLNDFVKNFITIFTLFDNFHTTLLAFAIRSRCYQHGCLLVGFNKFNLKS